MPLRLLHTADWQIGRVFSQFEPDDAAALFEARFASVERIAALANAHAVDAVLVAGDVFDAQTVADKTIRRLFQAMQAYAGTWLLLPGNHDAALAESVWTRAQRLGVLPAHMRACLEPRVQIINERFALLPAPLMQRHTYDDLTRWFDEAETPAHLPRVGLAHGSVQGVLAEDIDSANPIAADRATHARLDYLALGDWHGCKQIDARTWYAGTHEPERFKDNDPGHCLLVEIDGPGSAQQVQQLRCGRYRWQTLEASVQVASDLDSVTQQLSALGADDVLQLHVAGLTDLAGQRRLQHAIDDARARVRALVATTHALSLQPTPEDLDALHADGYVGEVLQTLRDEQAGADGERARDALVILAQLLDEQRARTTTRAGGPA
ncbi:MAG: DNA repair exonuclease [Aquimonas sp.]|nr:DNA repair exonuclease [Aquimonas sp.]